jgi:hypothetical protein
MSQWFQTLGLSIPGHTVSKDAAQLRISGALGVLRGLVRGTAFTANAGKIVSCQCQLSMGACLDPLRINMAGHSKIFIPT